MKNLTESQLQSIQSTVYVVEEKLRDMEAMVYFTLEHPEKGIQVALKHDLSPQELVEFQHKVTAIKHVLRKISDTYGLNCGEFSLKHLIGTKAAFMWEDITGADFDRLKRHGDVDESLRGDYEKLFDHLTELTDSLIIKS